MITKKDELNSNSLRAGTQKQRRRVSQKRYRHRHKKRYKTPGEMGNIFNAITEPIIVFDEDFKIININKAARRYFTGNPVGEKCFFLKHKFAQACKSCPIWQTIRSGTTTSSEIISPETNETLLLKIYPVYSKRKKLKGVVLIGRESKDIPIKWKRDLDA